MKINRLSDDDILLAVLGEAEDQGLDGMTALAEALRNRGSLKGVYGYKAIQRSGDNYFRGNRKLLPSTIKDAKQAVQNSINSNMVFGADHWENVTAFGKPYWADSMLETAKHGSHSFFKKK